MATLYELTGNYLYLNDLLHDDEADEQAVLDTLESIEGEIEDKADGYAKIIKQLEYDALALRGEETRMAERRRMLEKRAEKLKTTLMESMEITGKTKFKTPLFSFGIQNNPPSVVLDAKDLTKIPEDYLIPQDPKVDKKKLMDELKNGVALDGVAHLEVSRSLRIR